MNTSRARSLLPARLTHRSPVWADLEGWTLDPEHVEDPRTPEPAGEDTLWTRLSPWHRTSGPWRVDGRPAHGIYTRPAEHGLTDWAAADDGWMIWRWRGPRMTWRSPLVSPWNPIRAQALVLDELEGWGPDLGDWERWTAEAIETGRKPAGYFGIRPRPAMRAWVEQAGGLAVDFTERGCWAWAAVPGALGDHFDLVGLAAEYRRVLPAELGEKAAAVLTRSARLDVLAVAKHHEKVPEVLCGLVLGYPPEVTAGMILTRNHWTEHRPEAAEYGAYCPRCDPAYQR